MNYTNDQLELIAEVESKVVEDIGIVDFGRFGNGMNNADYVMAYMPEDERARAQNLLANGGIQLYKKEDMGRLR